MKITQVLFLPLLAGTLWPSLSFARVVILEEETQVYEIPRSQIKTYIQRGTIEQNLKPVKALKPGAVSDEELAAIPEKYLPPELKEKQKHIRDRMKLEQSAQSKKSKIADSVNKGLGGSNTVTIRGKDKEGKEKVLSLRIDEAIWVPPTQAASGQILAPQRMLPQVEKIEAISVSTSGQVKKEVEPGETREILELFQNGLTKDPAKVPLLKAFNFYRDKDYATAVTYALVVLADAKNENTKLTARYFLAHALFQAGFYASSLNHLSELVSSKWRRSVLGMATLALEKTRDDGAANQILSKISISQLPEEYRPLFSFHLGRILLNTGARDAALSAFKKVGSDNKRFPEAQYFMGVINSAEMSSNVKAEDWDKEGSVPNTARMHFEAAITAARTQGAQDLINLIRLSMARLAYQAKQYNQSIYYYDEVSTRSPFVRESSYESAWSLYRIGEFNRSLGVLHPLGSAYFESRDLAEIWILRSLNYLKLCRFDEAKKAANSFESMLKIVVPELQASLGRISPVTFKSATQVNTLDINEWLRNTLARDPVVQKDMTREALLLKERERLNVLRDNLRITDSELRKSAADVLQAGIDRKIAAIGAALKPYLISRIKDIQEEYGTQKERLDFLRFEIYNQATKFPKALERPEANKLIARGEFLPGVFLKGREIIWRFSGEYWHDELRGYDYFIPTECRSIE